jgi:hypothetical protein
MSSNVVANSVHVTVQPLQSSEFRAIGASVNRTDHRKERLFFPAVIFICKQLWFGCTKIPALSLVYVPENHNAERNNGERNIFPHNN